MWLAKEATAYCKWCHQPMVALFSSYYCKDNCKEKPITMGWFLSKVGDIAKKFNWHSPPTANWYVHPTRVWISDYVYHFEGQHELDGDMLKIPPNTKIVWSNHPSFPKDKQ